MSRDGTTRPRIAIPMPHSSDRDYAVRAIPQYERAVKLAGGESVRIALDLTAAQVTKIIEHCDGVLLPGSNADVDPVRFHAPRSPHTAAADPRRDAVDDLLLEDAYAQRKPVLGICYGLQSLNVYRKGSLIQHIPDFLPELTRDKVNHEAGRQVAVAHTVKIEPGSLLVKLFAIPQSFGGSCDHFSHHPSDPTPSVEQTDSRERKDTRPPDAVQLKKAFLTLGQELFASVNSSHHQSADAIGDSLRIVARCPDDGIIEALEGTSPDHFVLAVQWHPERSVDQDRFSREIFRGLVQAAHTQRKK
jgi:putative glutamine amidotransferase